MGVHRLGVREAPAQSPLSADLPTKSSWTFLDFNINPNVPQDLAISPQAPVKAPLSSVQLSE